MSNAIILKMATPDGQMWFAHYVVAYIQYIMDQLKNSEIPVF